MRIIVTDSSSLIDLKKGHLLDAFLDLPHELIVPESMLLDELLSFTESEVGLMRRKMTVTALDGAQIKRVHAVQHAEPALTLYDCMALIVATDNPGAILLTGDRRLRNVAMNDGIQAHGVLWIVQELANLQITPPSLLMNALERWRDDKLVRLPAADVDRLMRQLRKL